MRQRETVAEGVQATSSRKQRDSHLLDNGELGVLTSLLMSFWALCRKIAAIILQRISLLSEFSLLPSITC
jgi:hypothetical protein